MVHHFDTSVTIMLQRLHSRKDTDYRHLCIDAVVVDSYIKDAAVTVDEITTIYFIGLTFSDSQKMGYTPVQIVAALLVAFVAFWIYLSKYQS